MITSVVTCTLYFDAFIIELFKICLVISQNPGEGTLSKVFSDVPSVCKVGSLFTCGRSKLCMVPVILMGLEGAKRWGN